MRNVYAAINLVTDGAIVLLFICLVMNYKRYSERQVAEKLKQRRLRITRSLNSLGRINGVWKCADDKGQCRYAPSPSLALQKWIAEYGTRDERRKMALNSEWRGRVRGYIEADGGWN